MLNPSLHIICGKCGNKNMLSFKIFFDKESKQKDVSICCGNCNTISHLSEFLEVEK